MKAIITTVLLIVVLSVSGQEVTKKIDDFTGETKVKTSWQSLNWSGTILSYGSFRRIDEMYILDLKIQQAGNVFAVNEGNNIIFKFTDGTMIELYNMNYEITNIGGGAIGLNGSGNMGLELNLKIDKNQLNTLKEKTIEKIRVKSTDNLIDGSVKSKRSKKFKKLAEMILEN